MLWKSIKAIFRKAVFSIALRIALLYTCVMFVTLLVISSISYYSLKEDFHKQIHQSAYVFSASDLHELRHVEKEILEDYQMTVMWALLLGMLISVVSGLWMTKRSMFPIKAMAKTLQHLTMDELHLRLDSQGWPKELFVLAMGLKGMLGRLDGSFNRLKQFSADLAHEIRTPINNLLGGAEVALKQAKTPEDYQKILASAMQEYHRLYELVSGLLFLAEAESPEMKIKRENISVRFVLDSVCDYYSATAEEKQVTLQIEGDASVWVDSALFRRVLNNLLANELKYTPAKGKIRVSVSSEQNGTKIVISDNGEGIASEHLPHLLDRFYRTDAACSQQQSGLGLELAIVKSIMDLHHGSIHIESKLHKGTQTTLYFPAKA